MTIQPDVVNYYFSHTFLSWIDHRFLEIGGICFRLELSSGAVIENKGLELLVNTICAAKSDQVLVETQVLVLEWHLHNARLILNRHVFIR